MARKKKDLDAVPVSEIGNYVPDMSDLCDWMGMHKNAIGQFFDTEKTVAEHLKRLYLLYRGKISRDDDDETAEEADARLKRAKADLAELDRDKESGLLCYISDRNADEAQRIAQVKSRLLAVPDVLRNRLGLTVVQTSSAEQIIRDAMVSLSDELERVGRDRQSQAAEISD